MIYYIIKGQVFTVFLSMLHLTSIGFPGKLYDYVGGQRGDFTIYELNKKKALVFDVKRKAIDKNFIAFLKDSKYHFNLKYDESLSNKDIEIRSGSACSYFTLLKETRDYQLFECPRSLFLKNKTKNILKVNELVVKEKAFLSKGPPIYVNGKLIYYQGRLL